MHCKNSNVKDKGVRLSIYCFETFNYIAFIHIKVRISFHFLSQVLHLFFSHIHSDDDGCILNDVI